VLKEQLSREMIEAGAELTKALDDAGVPMGAASPEVLTNGSRKVHEQIQSAVDGSAGKETAAPLSMIGLPDPNSELVHPFRAALFKTCRHGLASQSGRIMSIAVSTDTGVKEVSVTEEQIAFRPMDGRVVSVPLAWSWHLSEATLPQRNKFEVIGDGYRVHWPDVDEDLSVEGMLH
jgi:hypothetical protein